MYPWTFNQTRMSHSLMALSSAELLTALLPEMPHCEVWLAATIPHPFPKYSLTILLWRQGESMATRGSGWIMGIWGQDRHLSCSQGDCCLWPWDPQGKLLNWSSPFLLPSVLTTATGLGAIEGIKRDNQIWRNWYGFLPHPYLYIWRVNILFIHQ